MVFYVAFGKLVLWIPIFQTIQTTGCKVVYPGGKPTSLGFAAAGSQEHGSWTETEAYTDKKENQMFNSRGMGGQYFGRREKWSRGEVSEGKRLRKNWQCQMPTIEKSLNRFYSKECVWTQAGWRHPSLQVHCMLPTGRNYGCTKRAADMQQAAGRTHTGIYKNTSDIGTE